MAKKKTIIDDIKDVFTDAPEVEEIAVEETPEKPKKKAKKAKTEEKSEILKIMEERAPAPEPEPEAPVETFATRMTAQEKEFARLFAIFRRNVSNPEDAYPYFDDIIGHTYQFDRYDPFENLAAYNKAKDEGTRIEISIGVLQTATGSIQPDGNGWLCTLEDDGNGNGVCIVYGDGPLELKSGTTVGMFTLDIALTAENKDIKVQNFCSCDNVTFGGGIGSSFGNAVADDLHGQTHRIPFISNGTDCTGQPGGTFRAHFQITLKNGKIGDTVRVDSLKIYRYDMA
jgi:hypothetical protein